MERVFGMKRRDFLKGASAAITAVAGTELLSLSFLACRK